MNQGIRKCPFCSHDRMVIQSDVSIGHVWWYVYCTNCQARGPMVAGGDEESNEAASYWNDREQAVDIKQAIREVLMEQEVIDKLAAAICKSPENFWNKPVTDYYVTDGFSKWPAGPGADDYE